LRNNVPILLLRGGGAVKIFPMAPVSCQVARVLGIVSWVDRGNRQYIHSGSTFTNVNTHVLLRAVIDRSRLMRVIWVSTVSEV
jgi:hypothetical protein